MSRTSTTGDSYLAQDLSYTAPLRITRQGPSATQRSSCVRRCISMTTMLHHGTHRSASEPRARGRRILRRARGAWLPTFASWEAAKPQEFEVESYLLLYPQSLRAFPVCQMHELRTPRPAARSDPGAFKLARREIILDQSVLGMANLAVFL